jgi:hypothetical protein
MCVLNCCIRRAASQYNGCKWRGSTLRVERAAEHYMTRLRREWQLAAKAAAARAAAAAAAADAATSAAAPAVAAAARQAITLQLQEATLLIQSRSTDKVRVHACVRVRRLRTTPRVCACPPARLPHPFGRSHSVLQYVKVHACGGRNAGRHKRSFQRLPGADAPNGKAGLRQPTALSAADLRSTLAASTAALVAPVAQRDAPASVAAAPAKMAARAARAHVPPLVDDAPLDPWARLFRRAAGVERVADVSDAEDAPPEEPTPAPTPAPPPPAAPLLKPKPSPAPAPSPASAPPVAAAPQSARPPRAAVQVAPRKAAAQVAKQRSAPQPAEVEEEAPVLTGAELDAALDAERKAQLRVLVRAHVAPRPRASAPLRLQHTHAHAPPCTPPAGQPRLPRCGCGRRACCRSARGRTASRAWRRCCAEERPQGGAAWRRGGACNIGARGGG